MCVEGDVPAVSFFEAQIGGCVLTNDRLAAASLVESAQRLQISDPWQLHFQNADPRAHPILWTDGSLMWAENPVLKRFCSSR